MCLTISLSLFIFNFSNSLPITGSNEIGLYEAAMVGGLSGFNKTNISAMFHRAGMYLYRITALKMLTNCITLLLRRFFRIKPEILLKIGAFLASIFPSISSNEFRRGHSFNFYWWDFLDFLPGFQC